MAKAKQAKKKKKVKKKKKGMSGLLKALLLAFCIPAIFTIGPTLLFLFFAMAPTIVAAFTHKEDQYKWISVGGLNLSGAFFFLFDLWFGANSIDMAVAILFNPISIVVMYGCAGIGGLLYTFFPKVCRSVLQVAAYKRIAELQQSQKKLLEEWGRELGEEVEAIEAKMGSSKTDAEIEALYLG